MPHIIVEYSEALAPSVDMPKLLDKLHHNLAEQESVNIHAIKSRAIPVQYSIVGDGQEMDKFVHIHVKLLPGRDDALKKKMAGDLFALARDHGVADERVSLSVEISELHAESYTK